jgi:hypothetical protein
MLGCDYKTDCDLYLGKLEIMPMTAELIKVTYCHKESDECGKYVIKSHEKSVGIPEDMKTQ